MTGLLVDAVLAAASGAIHLLYWVISFLIPLSNELKCIFVDGNVCRAMVCALEPEFFFARSKEHKRVVNFFWLQSYLFRFGSSVPRFGSMFGARIPKHINNERHYSVGFFDCILFELEFTQ